jgi:hypothetical protein
VIDNSSSGTGRPPLIRSKLTFKCRVPAARWKSLYFAAGGFSRTSCTWAVMRLLSATAAWASATTLRASASDLTFASRRPTIVQ